MPTRSTSACCSITVLSVLSRPCTSKCWLLTPPGLPFTASLPPPPGCRRCSGTPFAAGPEPGGHPWKVAAFDQGGGTSLEAVLALTVVSPGKKVTWGAEPAGQVRRQPQPAGAVSVWASRSPPGGMKGRAAPAWPRLRALAWKLAGRAARPAAPAGQHHAWPLQGRLRDRRSRHRARRGVEVEARLRIHDRPTGTLPGPHRWRPGQLTGKSKAATLPAALAQGSPWVIDGGVLARVFPQDQHRPFRAPSSTHRAWLLCRSAVATCVARYYWNSMRAARVTTSVTTSRATSTLTVPRLAGAVSCRASCGCHDLRPPVRILSITSRSSVSGLASPCPGSGVGVHCICSLTAWARHRLAALAAAGAWPLPGRLPESRWSRCRWIAGWSSRCPGRNRLPGRHALHGGDPAGRWRLHQQGSRRAASQCCSSSERLWPRATPNARARLG